MVLCLPFPFCLLPCHAGFFSSLLSPGVAARSRRAREVTAFEEGTKQCIWAKVVPLGILGQKGEVDVTLGIREIQPLEHRIAIAESGVDERHGIGRHVASARQAFRASSRFAAR